MLSFDSQTFTWLGRRLNSYAKGRNPRLGAFDAEFVCGNKLRFNSVHAEDDDAAADKGAVPNLMQP